MCMVQHMATTLIGGRARACGWNWKGQIKYSIFPKGANQRTFLPIMSAVILVGLKIGSTQSAFDIRSE